MSALEPPPNGFAEEVWCKNRLQQFTQKASMQLPLYETCNEGSQHAPQFRSRVWLDGTCFISPNTFSNRKMAEQDAAKLALVGIQEKVKNECFSRILEDTILWKSIINEYTSKMNLGIPNYLTKELKAVLPSFVSSLSLNGITYTGDAGNNKKEAEQFAARSAILSILDTESGTTMSEIVKSKFRLYDTLKNSKNSSNILGVTVPAGADQLEETVVLHKRKEVEVGGGPATNPSTLIAQPSFGQYHASQMPLSDCTSGQPSGNNVTCQPLHVFKRAKPQASSATIATPIVFVPPATIPPPVVVLPSEHPQICSTSGISSSLAIPVVSAHEKYLGLPANKKRNRKSKKRKNEVQDQSPLAGAVTPQTIVPAFSGPISKAVLQPEEAHIAPAVTR